MLGDVTRFYMKEFTDTHVPGYTIHTLYFVSIKSYMLTVLTSPLLAGIPCRDVTVEDSNVVKCVTGPQPPRSTYYPGMNVARKECVPMT